LPAPLDKVAKLVPLVAPDAQQRNLSSSYVAVNWRVPPPNPWVPTSFEVPKVPMVQVGYRVDPLSVGDASADVGFRRVQLPGCVQRRTIASLSGSRSALVEAICPRDFSPAKFSELKRPSAVAAVQLFSPRPAAADVRAAIRGELWRITLLQDLAEPAAAAARAGLKCEISFNQRGMRLLVAGYGQQLPRFLLFALKKTMRHVPPPSRSAELEAARFVAKSALGQGGTRFPRTLKNLAIVDRTTPTAMQREISGFFESVTGAGLLLTGAIGLEDAESLSLAVRNELKPSLQLNRPPAKSDDLLEQVQMLRAEEELQVWEGLLYKPVYSTKLAENVCFDPAVARALDSCGGL
jgi:hypothetical protein